MPECRVHLVRVFDVKKVKSIFLKKAETCFDRLCLRSTTSFKLILLREFSETLRIQTERLCFFLKSLFVIFRGEFSQVETLEIIFTGKLLLTNK